MRNKCINKLTRIKSLVGKNKHRRPASEMSHALGLSGSLLPHQESNSFHPSYGYPSFCAAVDKLITSAPNCASRMRATRASRCYNARGGLPLLAQLVCTSLMQRDTRAAQVIVARFAHGRYVRKCELDLCVTCVSHPPKFSRMTRARSTSSLSYVGPPVSARCTQCMSTRRSRCCIRQTTNPAAALDDDVLHGL